MALDRPSMRDSSRGSTRKAEVSSARQAVGMLRLRRRARERAHPPAPVARASMVTETARCLAPFPHQGVRMRGAVCERERGHPGPHCTPHAARKPAMWSADGSPLVSEGGRILVTTAELTDSDGAVWE